MDNKVLCKTEISEPKKLWYVVNGILVIALFLLMLLSVIPVRERVVSYTDYMYTECYNIFGDWIVEKDMYDPEDGIYNGTRWRGADYGGSFLTPLFNSDPYNMFTYLFIISSLILIWYSLSRSMCKKCTLELNQDGIYGKKKTLFSFKSINQPFEKIDNIFIRNSIIDKILGGQTIIISSSSSRIRFSCIDNAQEFTNRTLEELKKYKETINSKNENIQKTTSDNDATKSILELKNLLEQGFITQEEFESKRKSIIEKI